MTGDVQEVVEYLQSLCEETDISKKFKEKTQKVITLLTDNHQLAVENALLELEDLNSLDIPSYHRTQVWDVISMLESLKN